MTKTLDHLKQVEQAIEVFKAASDTNSLYLPVNYIMSLGGKRMRPVLLLMSNEMFGGQPGDAMPQAMGIEVFHNFTLLHDDIMDDAPIRRGQVTVHEKWDTNSAILSGDVMMVQANEFMCKCDGHVLAEVLDIFNQTAKAVCEGQQHDMDFESRNDVSVDEYIHMITLKTSVLVAGAMRIGAVIAEASDSDKDNVYEFGKNLGIAFQIQDDILDVYGDEAKFGKQVGGDIISNKKTLLLLSALNMAEGEDKSNLEAALAQTDFDSAQKVNSVKNLFTQIGVRKVAEERMNRYYNIALEHLEALQISEEAKEPIREIAALLMQREN